MPRNGWIDNELLKEPGFLASVDAWFMRVALGNVRLLEAMIVSE